MALTDIALWYLIIDNKRKRVGRNDKLLVSSDADVADLSRMVMEKSCLTNVGAHLLKVWKWPGGLLTKKDGRLDGQLRIFHEQVGVRELEPEEVLGGLEWSPVDLLVVQMPPAPGASSRYIACRCCLTSPPAITTIAGADITVWYLIVDNENGPVGHLSRVVLPSDAIVDDLTKTIKDENLNDLAKVDARNLTAWKLKEPPTLDKVGSDAAKVKFVEEVWPRQSGSATADTAMQELQFWKKLSMYEPWADEKLHVLVQMPAVDLAPGMSQSLYSQSFIVSHLQ